MLSKLSCAAVAVYFFAAGAALASERLPLRLVSSSSSFDGACANYYRQGSDTDVQSSIAGEFCTCIAAEIEAQGLDSDVLDFLGRTYSEDLTAFIGEYPQGEAWMESFFAADKQCKQNADFGSNQPPQADTRIEAGSWGGVVRDGPGQKFRKIATLAEGERVRLIENTGEMFNDYPWWKIEFSRGRSGYQWGGILCSLNAPIEGIYETCQ